MSRHKLVKTLNLFDELNEYDGGANYDQAEEAGDEQGERYKSSFRPYNLELSRTQQNSVPMTNNNFKMVPPKYEAS